MWQPEIMYEEAQEGQSQNFPFIPVPSDQQMPRLLYIYESRETGETEVGPEGEQIAVMRWDMHQYADMAVLKARLPDDVFDQVRVSLGLDPMHIALEKARKNAQNSGNN